MTNWSYPEKVCKVKVLYTKLKAYPKHQDDSVMPDVRTFYGTDSESMALQAMNDTHYNNKRVYIEITKVKEY